MSEARTIQPLDTWFRGRLFRSRLEARWATYLTCLGRPWDYEPQSFLLGAGGYLPDFWLPIRHPSYCGAGYWLEVKPGDPDERERKLMEQLTAHTGHHSVLIGGFPSPGEFKVWKTRLGPERPDNKRAVYLLPVHVDGSDPVSLYAALRYTFVGSDAERRVGPNEVLNALRAGASARFEHDAYPGIG